MGAHSSARLSRAVPSSTTHNDEAAVSMTRPSRHVHLAVSALILKVLPHAPLMCAARRLPQWLFGLSKHQCIPLPPPPKNIVSTDLDKISRDDTISPPKTYDRLRPMELELVGSCTLFLSYCTAQRASLSESFTLDNLATMPLALAAPCEAII